MSKPRQAPKHYPRVARLNEVVLECLATELDRLSDPRLGFVTLTSVEVVSDLRSADVWYSVLGTAEEHADTAAALASAGPHLRSVLGRHVRMKFTPELRFHEDSSVASGERIEAIIRDLHSGARPAEALDDEPTGGTR